MIITSVLPSKIISNDYLQEEFTDYNVLRLGKKIGIEERRVVSENESALDLAEKVCEKLFKTFDKTKVDFVLYCTQSPESPLPTTACLLQDRVGLDKAVGALDFNLGCSGYVYGLAVAKGLIKGGIAKNILLITAETYSKFLGVKDVTNKAIFGDGATATIVDSNLAGKLGCFNLGSDGSGANNLNVSTLNGELHMNGPEVYKFTLDCVPKSVEDCLEKNDLELSDIDLFIFHQANAYMLRSLRDRIGIDQDKFFIDVRSVGNTVSNSIPIAIESCLESGMIKDGAKVLLCGFGVGYSWSSTILKF